MRKIISKEVAEKRKKRNILIIGVILVSIMLLSILGYSSNRKEDDEESIRFNGIDFIRQDNLWYASIDNNLFSFVYSPSEINLNVELNFIESYYNKPLYIYSEDAESENEVYRNLFYQNQIVERVQRACIEGKDCNEDIPIKDCSDNLIIIKESEIDKLEQQENCVIIEGDRDELVKITDGFLMKIARIIQ